MNKMNAAISIAALVASAYCSNADTNSPQATLNVQEAKSTANKIPYKREIERGLTLQFDYINIPHGKVLSSKTFLAGNGLLIQGKPVAADPDEYMKFLSGIQKNGLIEIVKTSDNTNEHGYGEKVYDVKWTPKALGLRDEKNSDANWLRIPLGACKVQTIVKDVEYHNANFSKNDDFRFVEGTYKDEPTDFGKSQEAEGGAVFGVFKFRAVIKLNPFNQTYSYVSADMGKIDADGWQSQNIPE
jgi:hypothetical protein